MGFCTNERLLVGTRNTSRAFGGNVGAPDLMDCFFYQVNVPNQSSLLQWLCRADGMQPWLPHSCDDVLLDAARCCSPGKVRLDSSLCPGRLSPELKWVALFLDNLLRGNRAILVEQKSESWDQGGEHKRRVESRNRPYMGQVLDTMVKGNPDI